MDIKQEDRTLYVLNIQDTNHWWATVQPGLDDHGKRISDDECRHIATTLLQDRVARQEAQRELERYKGLLASSRLDLMRELKEQGWTSPGAPAPDSLRDKILDDLHALFDTEMITENDSGDELIRLTSAVAVVEEHLQAQAAAPVQAECGNTPYDEGPFTIAPVQAVPQWRPIETAPKDGSTVLVWFSDLYNGTADLARWDNDQYARKPRPYWAGNRERILGTVAYRQGKPTHWMPLPEPPNARIQRASAGAEKGDK